MNRAEAKDVMFGHLTTAWNAALTAHDLDGVLRFPDDGLEEPDNGTYWARVSIQTVDEDQETLRNQGVRRFLSVGLVFVQIFCPRSDDGAAINADLIAEDMRNALRNPRVDDNLEFTQAAIVDNVEQEPAWVTINVTARFWYREFM